jgi:hypothetical protein
MFRSVVLAAMSALVLACAGVTGVASAGTLDAPDRVTACHYYKLRSSPEPRPEPVNFATFLYETCNAANRSLERGLSVEHEAAGRLLDRIAELHWTVGQMNAARDEAVAGLTGVTRMLRLTRVTPTGEFLIAHRMGLFQDFETWLDTGADFSLAWYR